MSDDNHTKKAATMQRALRKNPHSLCLIEWIQRNGLWQFTRNEALNGVRRQMPREAVDSTLALLVQCRVLSAPKREERPGPGVRKQLFSVQPTLFAVTSPVSPEMAKALDAWPEVASTKDLLEEQLKSIEPIEGDAMTMSLTQDSTTKGRPRREVIVFTCYQDRFYAMAQKKFDTFNLDVKRLVDANKAKTINLEGARYIIILVELMDDALVKKIKDRARMEGKTCLVLDHHMIRWQQVFDKLDAKEAAERAEAKVLERPVGQSAPRPAFGYLRSVAPEPVAPLPAYKPPPPEPLGDALEGEAPAPVSAEEVADPEKEAKDLIAMYEDENEKLEKELASQKKINLELGKELSAALTANAALTKGNQGLREEIGKIRSQIEQIHAFELHEVKRLRAELDAAQSGSIGKALLLKWARLVSEAKQNGAISMELLELVEEVGLSVKELMVHIRGEKTA